MINRELIRIKTVQLVYAFYMNEKTRFEEGETELVRSLGTAYDLYNTMLALILAIGRTALKMCEAETMRAKRLGLEAPSRKFVDNRFMLQLEGNRQLQENIQNMRMDWANEEPFLIRMAEKIEQTDFYSDYMSGKTSTYDEDRELWRMIYRNLIVGNEEIDDILEDVNIYWNDDRHIIDTFVLKTINRFHEDTKDSEPLLPEFKSMDDLEFAKRLINQALRGADYYRNLIAQSTHNWDVERVPMMDRVILQVALAEITSFATIPVSVSINEYIELAKVYSTPNSGRYINATLDNIAKKLIAEKKLIKK